MGAATRHSLHLPLLFINSCLHENNAIKNIQSDQPLLAEKVHKDNIIPNQYIVVFKESAIASAFNLLGKKKFTDRESKAKLVEGISTKSIKKIDWLLSQMYIDRSKVLNYYTTKMSGITVKLTDKEFSILSKDQNIEFIEPDRRVELPEFEVSDITSFSESQKSEQRTPCGIKNAGGFIEGIEKSNWIWIIDSGIDLSHPDLNVITNQYAKSFIDDSPNDCNGHGTHVAGIAAAINNDFGVVGVSAGAPVIPLKVFSCSGGTLTSKILAAIDHIGNYDVSGDVVNLSLTGYIGYDCARSSSSYKKSLMALSEGGTYVSIAAGNYGSDASLFAPGCINGAKIYTVAAMNCDEFFSGFSNYRMNPIDFIATGTNVYSTYLYGGYATMSGTSMATPHVAGIMHARNRKPRSAGIVYDRGERYPIAIR